VPAEQAQEAETSEDGLQATDAASRKAEELNVDLSSVEGTGQGGRITVGDVVKASRGVE
jgi:pyruvate/2-oxoglutarate dehydrogenase complex dihydrolipoamide acyltransferase (E2) component